MTTSAADPPGTAVSRSRTDRHRRVRDDRWCAVRTDRNVDKMAPFLMSVVSDSDAWLFVGSNGAFTAGRRSPDTALFPYQTVDKILRDPATGGARRRSSSRATATPPCGSRGRTPSASIGSPATCTSGSTGRPCCSRRSNEDLGLRFVVSLAASDRFGLIRHASDRHRRGPVDVRYLDGWHQVIPPGVDQDTYARLATWPPPTCATSGCPTSRSPSTRSTPPSPTGPSRPSRCAGGRLVGRPPAPGDPARRHAGSARSGAAARSRGAEVRGEIGAYLVADAVRLAPLARHDWYTVGDTALDHAALLEIRELLRDAGAARAALEAAIDGEPRVSGAAWPAPTGCS